ncbi:MAG: P1 family peptidase [Bacteroidetes bacterium]|nr:P1 family peptidase [Bacteroidota bacterium]
MNNLITDVDGVKVGNYTDLKNLTGCTVILLPKNTIGSCDIRGGAPGSRELALLSPEKHVENINAIFLTGGSAFGLDATAGVMQFLSKKNIGYQTPWVTIPIVPAAVIFDYNFRKSKIYPNPKNGLTACKNASKNYSLGNVGAGTGATIGKWNGSEFAMKGGLGSASKKIGDLIVGAIAIVNSVGDILDENGKVLAGAISKNKFLGKAERDNCFYNKEVLQKKGNTTLVVVATNAILTKVETNIVANRMHNGFARAIQPVHTSFDGDISFAMATNNINSSVDLVAELSAEVTASAIRSAVLNAKSLNGFLGLKNNPHKIKPKF